MKVLIVFNHPAPYKVRAFNELAKYVDLDVIFERTKAGDRPDSFYNCNNYNFNVTFFHKGYFGAEGVISNETVNYIKNNYQKYDHIIMNGYSHVSEMKAISYLHKNNIPFTLMINGGISKKDFFIKKIIKKHFISKASFYLSPCKTANEYLICYGANIENIHLYPYSTYHDDDVINKPLNNEEKMEIRNKYELPEGKIFISAAQFIKRKNNEQLLELFKNRKDILLLVGSGKDIKKYQKFINDNNMKNVIIRPFLKKDQLFEVMKACDAFITLSNFDIYGQTTLEAFACGLPVISSNKVISSLEYIKNGINGYLVDLSDKNAITTSLNNISYEKMSVNAIKTAYSITVEKTGLSLFNTLKELK